MQTYLVRQFIFSRMSLLGLANVVPLEKLGGVPIFFHRCCLTRELFDLIIEIRPAVTSGGLAENIKHQSVLLMLSF